jgi:hypothetical protein
MRSMSNPIEIIRAPIAKIEAQQNTNVAVLQR